MKSFLVPIGGGDTDGAVLETALAAARPFLAHLRFLHVRVGVGEAAQHSPHMGFATGPALREALHELETQSQDRSIAAAQHVLDFCARSNIELSDAPGRLPAVTASCREEKGVALERIMFHARHSDLVIMGRSHKPNGLPADFLERLLLGCGRPVLIAGSSPAETVTGTIMVCWRESADAARAVTAAAPFLAQAQRVVFVSVTEKGQDSAGALDDVVRQFAWRGIPAAVKVMTPNGRPVYELLATAAEDCGADLVVSGAYGHSHLREVVFGGCTQSFIRNSDRPVLLMHQSAKDEHSRDPDEIIGRPVPIPPEQHGSALAERMCAAYHAVGRSGRRPHIGAPAFRQLDRRFDLDAFMDRLREGLMAGHPDMPIFRFGREDARALIIYLRSIQAP